MTDKEIRDLIKQFEDSYLKELVEESEEFARKAYQKGFDNGYYVCSHVMETSSNQVDQLIEAISESTEALLERLDRLEEENDIKFTYSCMIGMGKVLKDAAKAIKELKQSK